VSTTHPQSQKRHVGSSHERTDTETIKRSRYTDDPDDSEDTNDGRMDVSADMGSGKATIGVFSTRVVHARGRTQDSRMMRARDSSSDASPNKIARTVKQAPVTVDAMKHSRARAPVSDAENQAGAIGVDIDSPHSASAVGSEMNDHPAHDPSSSSGSLPLSGTLVSSEANTRQPEPSPSTPSTSPPSSPSPSVSSEHNTDPLPGRAPSANDPQSDVVPPIDALAHAVGLDEDPAVHGAAGALVADVMLSHHAPQLDQRGCFQMGPAGIHALVQSSRRFFESISISCSNTAAAAAAAAAAADPDTGDAQNCM
jgi:hypothetical protein